MWAFAAMVLLTGVISVGAFAEELSDTYEGPMDITEEPSVTHNEVEDMRDTLNFESIIAIDGVKENIFNNLLNSVDYYDAVEGEFTTTLWSDDEDFITTVSYVSNIPEQESYQRISENSDVVTTEVYVTEGRMYTVDNVARSYRVMDFAIQDVGAEREKKDTNICVSAIESSRTKKAQFESRVGVKEDGIPVYRYRNDLTNASYAAVSIFPQSLTFGLLTDMDNWEIVGTGKYLGRNTIIIRGVVSDPVYSEKINSVAFELTIDFETGIILEFVGFDAAGNETESIRTKNINIIENMNMSKSNLTNFVSEALSDLSGYVKEEIVWSGTTDNTEESNIIPAATAARSISCTIDNDTSNSSYYNERNGFLAYLNDSNYYNRDMRRTDSSSNSHSYAWLTHSPLQYDASEGIDIDLDIYLYSSTSKDPAATYAALSVGTTGGTTGRGICTKDQSVMPNGWCSCGTSTVRFYDYGSFLGIELTPSGRGSTYTGADAVSFYAEIA